MEYNTYEPHPYLAPFVKCYWTLEIPSETKPQKQRIVPDGCMEIIFHYGDLYKQYLTDGSYLIQPKCFVFGQITKYLEIEPTGFTGIFAIRFHPEGLVPFINFPLNELENKATDLTKVFGDSIKELEQSILNSSHTDERLSHIETFLIQMLTSSDFIDKMTTSCVNLIFELKGKLSVDEISEQLQVNRRQLERKFAKQIGLSPKQLSKIIRIQTILSRLKNNLDVNLTELATEGNFYDQAHFIKDFKEFTGLSPKKFYAENLKLSSLFIE